MGMPLPPPEVPDDCAAVTLPQLVSRSPAGPLPLPVPNARLLPLADLEPPVLERLAAELVSRRLNRGAQFYGRSGQKQYGLDIVERERDGRRSLYQVKRFQTISGAELRSAVEDYAGAPRPLGTTLPPRLFDPYRFVVVTSAEFERDTENVDTLSTLQDDYDGDIEIEVWGAEELGRALRYEPRIVYAVFGAAWAKEWCSYVPDPGAVAAPQPLGLVEDPVAVLNLGLFLADARAAETAQPPDHGRAAQLYAVLSRSLAEAHFPGHASLMALRQAEAFKAAGQAADAFDVLANLTIDRLRQGETSLRGLRAAVEPLLPSLAGVNRAKWTVSNCVGNWYENGCALEEAVPALKDLLHEGDSYAAFLCCMAIEQALVDGLYDFRPARSIVGGAPAASILAELRNLAEQADSSDVTIRARLACAIADSTLSSVSTPDDVEAAYRGPLSHAFAGRFLHARGLVTARAARAFAVHGAVDRAEDLWRAAFVHSSEDGYYGDARHALRAVQRVRLDEAKWQETALAVTTSAMPHRKRLLAAAQDAALSAYAQAHDGKLANAFADVRRYLWESRLGGGLQEEFLALALLGDVLQDAGHSMPAIEAYVEAGEADKAAELAAAYSNFVDVSPWLASPVRRRRAAAIKVLGAQAAVVPDGDVARLVDAMLETAANLWMVPSAWRPNPELDAVETVARFGIRIPPACVDKILTLAQPALTKASPSAIGNALANLLIQTFWAVEHRRSDLAQALASMAGIPEPPPHLWDLIEGVPPAGRAVLLPVVAAALAAAPDPERRSGPVGVLASWGVSGHDVELAARRACAALLRKHVGLPRTVTYIGTQETSTVELLLCLAAQENPIDVAPSELGPDSAQPAGGVLLARMFVGDRNDADPDSTPCGEPAAAEPTGPDEAAVVAAGPPAELVTAVARHLTAMVEDTEDSAGSRAQAASAVDRLAAHVPRNVASELADRLIRVHAAPGYSEADLLEMKSDGLSRVHIASGGSRLAGLALVGAAKMFSASREQAARLDEKERDLADQIVTSAARALSSDLPVARVRGAMSIAELGKGAPELGVHIAGLVFHVDEQVRAVGAAHVNASQRLLTMLAADPSPRVRAAVAHRAEELPADVRHTLEGDPHLAVRHAADRAGNASCEPG